MIEVIRRAKKPKSPYRFPIYCALAAMAALIIFSLAGCDKAMVDKDKMNPVFPYGNCDYYGKNCWIEGDRV